MKLFSLFKPRELPKSTEISLFVAIIIGFTAFSIATIGNSSIWFDEAFGAYMIKFNFAEIFKFTGLDVHPPLYYWLLKLWGMVFGTSDVELRSMSVLFAVIAIIFAYLLVRKMFGQKAALISSALVMLSPIFIRYAQEMRMYTMVAAIGMSATYVLYLIREKSSRRLWVVYGVLIALGMWTHYFTALIWLGHWVWRAIETHQKDTKAWKKAFFTRQWVLVHAFAIALYLPWIPKLISQVLNVQVNGFWIPPISPVTVPSYLSTVFVYQTASMTAPWLTVLLAVMLACGVYMVQKVYRAMKRRDRMYYRLLIIGAVAPVALLIAISLPPLRSTFIDRYVLFSAIMLVIVFGVAVARYAEKSQRIKWLFVGLILVLSFAGISNVYTYGNYNMNSLQKSETKELIQAINDTSGTTGQPIIADTPWIYYEAAQYSSKSNGVFFIDKYVEYKFGSLEMLRQSDRGKIKNLDTFLAQHPLIWYIGIPGASEIQPPSGNVQIVQRIRIDDSITKKPAYEAVQYRVIGE